MLKFLNMFWFMLKVDPIQSYLNLKIGLPPVLKAGSSGMCEEKFKKGLFLDLVFINLFIYF